MNQKVETPTVEGPGFMALKEAARKAKSVLLEHTMKVEVVVPEEFMGSVTGDLH